jgi:outer membrane scaffolding protein for murein synthesis (MipA/OmpV family)
MRHASIASLLAAIALIAAGEARAEEATGGPQYVLDLGVGGMAKPTYPGADSYIFVPYPIIEVGRFYAPLIGQTEKKTSGFFIYPSLGFNGERKPSDDPSLSGTKKIPWALELGLGAGVRSGWLKGFVAVRQGINGADGQVGDLGLDVIAPVSPRIEVAFGPRASFASKSYMETYFGITAAEAAAGPLPEYKPDGGFKSVGLAAKVSYAITDRTRLQVKGGWDRLIGEAGDSPIVKAGSADQWMAGIGISHRFSFDLFN